MLETDRVAYGSDEVVDPRMALVVRASEAGEAQGGALDTHGCVRLGQAHDRLTRPPRERAGSAHDGWVELENGRASSHSSSLPFSVQILRSASTYTGKPTP